MSYSQNIVKSISDHFDTKPYNISFDKENGIITLVINLECKIKHIVVRIIVFDTSFMFLTNIPFGPDPDKREVMAVMCEYLTRCNYGMKNGTFEMDLSDGEIRFKVFYDVDEYLPSGKILDNGLALTIGSIERYGNGIVNIALNNLHKSSDAEDEYQKAEELFEDKRNEMISHIMERTLLESMKRKHPESMIIKKAISELDHNDPDKT